MLGPKGVQGIAGHEQDIRPVNRTAPPTPLFAKPPSPQPLIPKPFGIFHDLTQHPASLPAVPTGAPPPMPNIFADLLQP